VASTVAEYKGIDVGVIEAGVVDLVVPGGCGRPHAPHHSRLAQLIGGGAVEDVLAHPGPVGLVPDNVVSEGALISPSLGYGGKLSTPTQLEHVCSTSLVQALSSPAPQQVVLRQ